MTSFGLCKVFHYEYNTTGDNFTGHYYVLHMHHHGQETERSCIWVLGSPLLCIFFFSIWFRTCFDNFVFLNYSALIPRCSTLSGKHEVISNKQILWVFLFLHYSLCNEFLSSLNNILFKMMQKDWTRGTRVLLSSFRFFSIDL